MHRETISLLIKSGPFLRYIKFWYVINHFGVHVRHARVLKKLNKKINHKYIFVATSTIIFYGYSIQYIVPYKFTPKWKF